MSHLRYCLGGQNTGSTIGGTLLGSPGENITKLGTILPLTSIAGLVHVNDLDLTTEILVSSCHICSVYAIKEFGYPPKIFRHLWIFLWVLKLFFLIHTMLPPSKVIGFLFIYNDFRCNTHMGVHPIAIPLINYIVLWWSPLLNPNPIRIYPGRIL